MLKLIVGLFMVGLLFVVWSCLAVARRADDESGEMEQWWTRDDPGELGIVYQSERRDDDVDQGSGPGVVVGGTAPDYHEEASIEPNEHLPA